MKSRELSLGEKQAIRNLRKEGKLIRGTAQTLGIDDIANLNVLKNKQTLVHSATQTGVISMTSPRTEKDFRSRNIEDANLSGSLVA